MVWSRPAGRGRRLCGLSVLRSRVQTITPVKGAPETPTHSKCGSRRPPYRIRPHISKGWSTVPADNTAHRVGVRQQPFLRSRSVSSHRRRRGLATAPAGRTDLAQKQQGPHGPGSFLNQIMSLRLSPACPYSSRGGPNGGLGGGHHRHRHILTDQGVPRNAHVSIPSARRRRPPHRVASIFGAVFRARSTWRP